jgi:large subunit ribosomal protein L15
MELSDLRPAPGSVKRRKKIGRGIGSGHGKTATRGHKGDKARGQSKLGFEGGQTPLHRRLPKQRGIGTGLSARGFNTGAFKTHYAIVNLGDLERFDAGTSVDAELLLARKVIKDLKDGLKVLGDGKLTKAITVRAHAFSETAKSAIEAAGGTAEAIPVSKLPKRPKKKDPEVIKAGTIRRAEARKAATAERKAQKSAAGA